ncbi:uncharacterized protein NECHADRAFT_81103 [Fusarium vanettenii 77-13-4]|uniref:Adenylate kinase n=1 Tax=Fusarium vanettenii (strain ATCC MYA-4622 / CBS 123669 / FGSC 9596 / NRRL 45880 / 77-13-4) TaxID=660122 RepID=C7ZGN2_FUSV7|nr:uncharacterized protein NECHADRAFT_81103 [Fusarium vanettenii 77-13-4]EEU36942.1 hypothetical protein NECHADRAFT_81103 [Fusarium vanettenii 77-13-4]
MTEPKLIPTSEKLIFIGMLGGPGSGKSSQCRLLAQTFKVEHVSVGDLLWAEMNREGSPHAATIRGNMMEGTIGSKELTVGLLKSHIRQRLEHGMRAFIIDGFPRDIVQLQHFEVEVGALECLIHLDCPNETLMHRLSPRGRFDDQVETIRGRLRTFNTITSEAIEYFRGEGKLKVLNGDQAMEMVQEQLRGIIEGVAELRQTS